MKKMGLTSIDEIARTLGNSEKNIMIKKFSLVLSVLGLGVIGAFAALNGTDNAADPAYSGNVWANGSNGGTVGTFNPWDLTNNNNDGTTNFAGYFIGDSTLGSGDINTGGVSFGVYANPATAFADADRNFGAPLAVGQTFSLDIAVNFQNGNKGLNLFAGATQVFNFNVGGNDYQINGTSLGLAYSSTAIFDLSFTQTSLAGGTYLVTSGSSNFTNSYTGSASGFNLYNSGTDNGSDANNLYFNNLAIVPEPSSLALLAGPMLLGAWFFARRRRSV